ncbi:hypothetical protein [Peterkaempfera griseoplana]|uniref:hypothetical protein n=1 Tax=Peterkaempfera griseoplana TaxID=66896 RepID=UPI0006E318B7|nr:hypothetical protein [Peterkaempfera griseoplana]
MPNTSPMTYERVAVVLQEIGMVSKQKAQSVLDDFAAYAHDELKPYEVACTLVSFGLAVSVHADDIDYLEPGYAWLLEEAAAVTGGAVTVSDVRLHEGEFEGDSRDDVLEFRCNGRPVSIPAEHFSDEYYDQLAACDAIAEVSPDGDPRSFRLVDFARERHGVYDSIMVLTTPEQAQALQRDLGLTIR